MRLLGDFVRFRHGGNALVRCAGATSHGGKLDDNVAAMHSAERRIAIAADFQNKRCSFNAAQRSPFDLDERTVAIRWQYARSFMAGYA
jgi:hypothetical protein